MRSGMRRNLEDFEDLAMETSRDLGWEWNPTLNRRFRNGHLMRCGMGLGTPPKAIVGNEGLTRYGIKWDFWWDWANSSRRKLEDLTRCGVKFCKTKRDYLTVACKDLLWPILQHSEHNFPTKWDIMVRVDSTFLFAFHSKVFCEEFSSFIIHPICISISFLSLLISHKIKRNCCL